MIKNASSKGQSFVAVFFCACGYNVSKMYTNCLQNVSADIDLGLDIDLD